MRAAAEKVVSVAADAIAARGRFTWALSGGSTPKKLYALLASVPFVGRIEWDRVHFFWGDERCVPPEHPDSNYRMAKDALLSAVHPPSGNVHRMPGEAEPETGAAAYEATLRRVFFDTFGTKGDVPRFDLVLLGMGPDGHTASLFPGAPTLGETRRWVVPTHVQQTIPDRLTMTLPVLNGAAHVAFLVAGADKAERVRDVIERSPGTDLPSQLIRPVRGQVQWLLDAPAAALLRRSS